MNPTVYYRDYLEFALLTVHSMCYRTGRAGVLPQQVRDGLPQHRVPGVCGWGCTIPGDSRGTGHPGPAAATPHESPAVLLRTARASCQAEPLVPWFHRNSYTPTLQVRSCFNYVSCDSRLNGLNVQDPLRLHHLTARAGYQAEPWWSGSHTYL